FAGARLLLCVRQTHLKDDGSQSIEWRYFVTSLSTVEWGFAHLLRLVRLHWAIENRHHWTLDMVLEEDDRQPCLHSRSALEVTAWLRVLAYNLLSAWRARLPLKDRLPVGGLGTRLRDTARRARPRSGGGAPAHTRLKGSPAPPPSLNAQSLHGRPAERHLIARARPLLSSSAHPIANSRLWIRPGQPAGWRSSRT
ncbi:hypothetical protein SYV04_40960, partial [Hyalangium sp. s54d21]|nr:hypothetical protein [Hyalangium sp. s54d21]